MYIPEKRQLPTSFQVPTSQMLLTPSRLCNLNFNEEEIIEIIRNLNVHKAHDHDDIGHHDHGNISIRMIKICDKSVLKPLTLSWWTPLSYRNQSIDLQSKSMDWLLYDNGLRHERVKSFI